MKIVVQQLWFLFSRRHGTDAVHGGLFLWVVLANICASMLEGISFIWVLVALSALGSGQAIEQALETIPGIHFLGLEWLATWNAGRLFIVGILLAVATQVIRACCAMIGQIASGILGNRWQIFFQDRIYQQIMSLSFSCASHYKVGDLVEYAKAPAQCIPPVMDQLNKSIVACLTVIVLLGTMWTLSPFLTGLVLLVFGFFGGAQKWIVNKVASHSQKLANHLSDFSKDTVQVLHGLRVIFLFDRQQEMLQRMSSVLGRIAKTYRKMNFWSQLTPFLTEIFGVLLVGLFLWIGQQQGGAQESVSMLVTFVTMVYRLNGRVQGMLTSFGGLALCCGQMARMVEILRRDDKEFAPQGGGVCQRFERAIQFQGIRLRYPGRSNDSLMELSCTFPKGKMTALVGLSGAGKSSVLDLLLRLYQPTEGCIEMDGIPIETYALGSWRRLFGVVSQDIFIFNETVEENLRFGDAHATLHTIQQAAQMAGADEFIQQLPQGYQTIVGERGYRLSGGERQRLALARALVKNPEILVLDEATSHLDSTSEARIQKALRRLQQEKTVVVVAHRLSTIVHADQILVMEQGTLQQQGTHEELISCEGIYKTLWNLQSPQRLSQSLESALYPKNRQGSEARI